MKLTLRILLFAISLHVCAAQVQAKKIALTFDDAPSDSSPHFGSEERTTKLIRKLRDLALPQVMIFSNPCKLGADGKPIEQLKLYKDAGHLIANHTCTHPRLDEVGFDAYTADIKRADGLLVPLIQGQKYFRFPFLNEGNDQGLRDSVRKWLKKNGYRNAGVTVDNDDYLFAHKMNLAKSLGKKIDYDKVKDLYLDHVIGAAEYYDDLARRTLGHSPKHVLLLHEVDSSVLFIGDLVARLRSKGWTLISAAEAFQDPVYRDNPKSTYAGNGIIAQLADDKLGQKLKYGDSQKLSAELDKILGL